MAQVKFASNMDKNGIVAAIKSIEGRGAKLDNDIALTGLSVLAHIDVNKEVSLFQKLFNAMPKGARRNALVAWALAHGKIAVNMDKATSKDIPFVYDGAKATKLEEATKQPWFEFRKEAAPREAFSLEATIQQLHELLKRQVKAGKVDANDRRVQVLLAVSPEAVVIGDDTEGSNDSGTEIVVTEAA